MKQERDLWIIKAFLMTFFITIFFSGISNLIANNFNYIILIILTLFIILIGIMFDIIGTSVLTAKEATFHAKSSKKIKGAKETIDLIKNQNIIASICNDVIGDICGIVSGSMGAMLGVYINIYTKIPLTVSALIIASIISSLTVGGKAIGKKIAIKNSDEIIFAVGKIVSIFKRK